MHVCMYTGTALPLDRYTISQDHTEMTGELHGHHPVNIPPKNNADIDTNKNLRHIIEEKNLTRRHLLVVSKSVTIR